MWYQNYPLKNHNHTNHGGASEPLLTLLVCVNLTEFFNNFVKKTFAYFHAAKSYLTGASPTAVHTHTTFVLLILSSPLFYVNSQQSFKLNIYDFTGDDNEVCMTQYYLLLLMRLRLKGDLCVKYEKWKDVRSWCGGVAVKGKERKQTFEVLFSIHYTLQCGF